MSLVETERATYEALWGVPDYAKASPGEQLVAPFLEMSGATPSGKPHWSEQFPVGHKYREFLAPRKAESVLDAGCGSGKGAVQLAKAGFRVALCDLTDAGLIDEAKALPFFPVCLWEPLGRQIAWAERQFDWAYCCDVLEHIPPTFAMLVVSRLLEATRQGVFLSIALQEDNFGAWAGRALHLSVQSFTQWRDQLSAIGTVKECRDLLGTGLYLMEPK